MALQERLPGYDDRRTVRTLEGELRLGPEDFTQSLRPSDRIQLRHEHGGIVQVGPGLMTVNHVRPYPGWEAWLPEVRAAMRAYSEVFEPKEVLRVALVCLNQFELPGTRVTLDQWLGIFPHLGPELPDAHGAFRVAVEFDLGSPGQGHKIRVDLASRAALQDDHLGIDLIVRATPFEEQPSPENLIDLLDRGHLLVEEVFEGCLTPRLREHFEEIRDE